MEQQRRGVVLGSVGQGKLRRCFPVAAGWLMGKQLGAFSVDPGDRHPLWRGAGLLKGFLQQLEALFHAVVDQRQVEVVCVPAADVLRVLAQLLQSL